MGIIHFTDSGKKERVIEAKQQNKDTDFVNNVLDDLKEAREVLAWYAGYAKSNESKKSYKKAKAKLAGFDEALTIVKNQDMSNWFHDKGEETVPKMIAHEALRKARNQWDLSCKTPNEENQRKQLAMYDFMNGHGKQIMHRINKGEEVHSITEKELYECCNNNLAIPEVKQCTHRDEKGRSTVEYDSAYEMRCNEMHCTVCGLHGSHDELFNQINFSPNSIAAIESQKLIDEQNPPMKENKTDSKKRLSNERIQIRDRNPSYKEDLYDDGIDTKDLNL